MDHAHPTLPPSSTPASQVLDVAAGLIFRDRKLLITQRQAGSHLGGLWEFPGGKREAGETFEACLRRELLEELGIEVEVGPCFETITHEYPEKSVRLKFFHCAWRRREPQTLGCAAFRWVCLDELGGFKFPAADARLLERLRVSPQIWL